MIIVRVPLRVSLFGGGTDLPDYFERYGGSVTGFTINKYIYIFASKVDINQGFKFRLSYRTNQDVNTIDEISHPIFREVLRSYNFDQTYHFSTMSCLPSGAGLGSSSSFTVGLHFLLNTLVGVEDSRMDLAKNAIHIERNVLAESGGWQDQLHPAFGGFNTFNFNPGGLIERKPLDLKSEDLKALNRSMYILYSGEMREAKVIEDSKKMALNYDLLKETHDIAREGEKLLRGDSFDLLELGKLLNEGWLLKRGMSRAVSNSSLDNLYDLILKKGAYGAKLCGAGGGGFFLVLASESVMTSLNESLPNSTMSQINIDFNGLMRNEM